MHNKKVVIIGSGLGGLSCGVILAKNGFDVTVLEKSAQIGGCLQCFSRHGAKFETGMHFIGSAEKGQTLSVLMDYLEINKDIRLSQLDTTGYDVISLCGETFKFANGRDQFISQMVEYFPHQRENIINYYNLVEMVSNASSLHSLNYIEADTVINTRYQMQSVNTVLDEVITDPLLAKVLVGTLPLYAAEWDKTPFSTHAFIMDFYNKSAFRIIGGSDAIATSMKRTIEKYGGAIYTNSPVTHIQCNESHAIGVEVGGEKFINANYIISDIHPQRTIELIDSRLLRPAFKNRVKNFPQTVGGFSVYLEFKDETVPYMNYNYYGYNTDTPWGCEDYDEISWPKGYLYMHFCHENQSKFAKTGVVLSYMQMKDVEKWVGTSVGKRGADYEQFKKMKAEKLLNSLELQFPGIRSCIKSYYTSTPLTYLNYTGTEGGSMYGVAKDVRLGIACRVPHRMKIPNLYQTGQNINSHGMLGVLVGTIVTCSEFLPTSVIFDQIIKTSNE